MRPAIEQKIASLTEPSSQTLPTLEDLCDISLSKDINVTQLIHLASKTQHRQQRDGGDGREGASIDPKSVPVLKLETDLYFQYLARKRAQFINVLSLRIFPIEEVFAFR